MESSACSTTPASSAAAPLLAFDRVTKRRANGRALRVVLDRVSFEIAPGEYVGLRGPRRSGKTTLLRIAAGIDLPEDGRVVWRGRVSADRARVRRTALAPEVAFVAQASDWRGAPGKVMLDHVALPLMLTGRSVAESLAAARSMAAELGVEAYVDLPPHALPPDVLTALALARALVREPRLLIVDSPADSAGEGEQQTVLQQLLACVQERRGMALLVASREASTLRAADRIMTLDGSGHLRVPERSTARVLPFPGGAPAS